MTTLAPSRNITTDVVQGVHRVEDAYVNWYLLEDADGITIVDSGVPVSWQSLPHALGAIGRSLDDVRALVLTHAHYDHVGFAAKLYRETGVPIHLPAGEVHLARHPQLFRFERFPLLYLWRPGALRVVGAMTAARGPLARPVPKEAMRTFSGDTELDVPGRPWAFATPGHTADHHSLHLRDRDAVIAGDALVTLDPYTGRTGPRLVARAATENSRLALQSLSRIAETGASVVLPGHGEPYLGGAASAAVAARLAGAA
jgi:glyoxylase-like metal-dependent hydrolase (beta-lactamase superfamily II)